MQCGLGCMGEKVKVLMEEQGEAGLWGGSENG